MTDEETIIYDASLVPKPTYNQIRVLDPCDYKYCSNSRRETSKFCGDVCAKKKQRSDQAKHMARKRAFAQNN